MTIEEALRYLTLQLHTIYPEQEASAVADWVMEHVTHQKKIERVINKNLPLSVRQELELKTISEQLLQNKPIQYILKEAWFAGMNFYVDEHVLIPRPETEELVEWIKDEVKSITPEIKNIIDIGTGSGCIAIALKNKLPNITITAVDVSEKAIEVAKKNARLLKAEINFTTFDFLQEKNWQSVAQFDIIVSNPPYIKLSEKEQMHNNVTEYEPHTALFVPDDSALLFYKKIAAFAQQYLNPQGIIFIEINEALGDETLLVFNQIGFVAELRKDMQGKNRMIKAMKK
jgi:release factor glutamine methyltransferase